VNIDRNALHSVRRKLGRAPGELEYIGLETEAEVLANLGVLS
jgi:hypothetical protein